jgi:CMP/dCMP kinase
MSIQVIAIDGPAASGKSSAARRVAAQLGWLYVNTGNMFRAITLAVVRSGVALSDADAIRGLNSQLQLDYIVADNQLRVALDGVALSDEELNSPAVNAAVSYVAGVPEVRQRLKEEQRALVKHGSLVMEGRDIGSVIFPESPNKFFITASEEVRQMRREAQGHTDSITQRDKLDTSRKTAPLIVPEGAIVVDSSDLGLEQVVAEVLRQLRL